MSTGHGELTIKNRLNSKWESQGYCIRLQQRQGDPEVISDLIFSTSDGVTFSIEVKRITNKMNANHTRHKTRPLSFEFDFSVSTRDIEFRHQLERQVKLCERMGWIPMVLLQVVKPCVGTEEYLFNADDLYRLMKAGIKSLNSSEFKELHQTGMYKHLFEISKASS